MLPDVCSSEGGSYVLCCPMFAAVKVADQIQKEITAKRSEVDNLRSKARRLEEKMETITKVWGFVLSLYFLLL